MSEMETLLELEVERLKMRVEDLEAEIKFLQINPRPVETLLRSEVEHLEINVADLEAELAKWRKA